MSGMNIAMFLETLSFSNGVSRVALALGENFVKRGHEVHIYSSVNRLGGRGRERYPDPRMDFHWLPSLRGSWRTWSLPLGALIPALLLPMAGRLPPKLGMQRRRHDVIVSHALTLSQDVVQMHNDPQPTEERKLSSVPFAVDPPRLRSARRSLRTVVERLRFAPGNYRSVVAHSRRSAAEISASFGIPEGRIDVIPHGVDSAYFCPSIAAGQRVGLRRQLGLSLDDVVYLYIGDSWKGLEFAIRGMSLLPAGSRAVLLAAGPFPRPAFVRFAREHGVRFISENLWDDVRSLYSVADVLLTPTPLDTFFLVGLEAMSMRLPLITTQFAGLSELLTHGENALILDSASDPGPIAEACAKLLQPDIRLRMAEKARQFALTRTWDESALLHLRHYAALRGPAAVAHSPLSV